MSFLPSCYQEDNCDSARLSPFVAMDHLRQHLHGYANLIHILAHPSNHHHPHSTPRLTVLAMGFDTKCLCLCSKVDVGTVRLIAHRIMFAIVKLRWFSFLYSCHFKQLPTFTVFLWLTGLVAFLLIFLPWIYLSPVSISWDGIQKVNPGFHV